MPRPEEKKKEKLTSHLPRTRCTEMERKTIEEKAEQAGLSLSEFQRRSCLDSLIVTRSDLIDRETYRALRGIANNLNQLTRKTHIHDDYDKERLHEILGIVEEVGLQLLGYSK